MCNISTTQSTWKIRSVPVSLLWPFAAICSHLLFALPLTIIPIMSSVNCKETTYETSLHRYFMRSGVAHHMPLEKVNNSILIYLFYQSTDVKNSQQTPLMTFWGFISACGGSLGLFLGVSCLSSVWTFINMIEKNIQENYHNRQNRQNELSMPAAKFKVSPGASTVSSFKNRDELNIVE